MFNRNSIGAVAALSGLAAGLAWANVTPASVIGSNMVVQQSSYAPIWGVASPREEIAVTASWLKEPVKTAADANGRWMVRLKTPAASEVRGASTITISGTNTIVCENVAIGEVWLVSGQSNMEWPVAASNSPAAETGSANRPRIRYFTAANETAIGPREDCTREYDEGWRVMSPSTAAECTAVGYFFAKEIESALNVPVGILQSDWGGTPVESWTPGSALKSLGEYGDFFKEVDAIDKDPGVREKRLADQTAAWWDGVDGHPKSPGAGWAGSGFSDSAWSQIQAPGVWSGDLAGFDGFVFMRRSFDAPAGIAGKPARIELGPIDDRDDVYINGVRVGSTRGNGRSGTPRRYEVPADVIKAGPNVVAIRVRDDQGPGGIGGEASGCVLRSGDVAIPLAGMWKYAIGPSAADLAMPALVGGVGPWTPTSLYNAMIHPIRHYGIRGALWYQGESNRGRPEQYQRVFPGMIAAWREAFGIGEFPFYFVQIAPFNYGPDPGVSAELRDVQTRTLMLSPNTGMVCTMDIGDPKDIHPKNKQEVGRRLALQALAKTYGKQDVVCDGPMYSSMKVDGDSIVVSFALGGSKGLSSRGGALTHFQVAGEDRVFHRATASIEGETVRVRAKAVKNPVAVRYGWEGACEPNLCNNEGLPGVPFRSDDWERPAGGWAEPKD